MGLLHLWDLWMAANDLSPKTRADYGYSLLKFLSWPGDDLHAGHIGRDLRSFTDVDITIFLAKALENKAHSKQQYVKALRSLFGWLLARGEIERNPMAIVKPKRPRRTPQEPHSPNELTRLVIAGAQRHPRRGWAIIACYGLAARRSEMTSLRPEDIDWEHRKVRLLGKGPKVRRVALGHVAERALRELLALGPEPRGTVPGTILGIRPQQFGQWVHQAAVDCGFEPGRKRRAHTLRATAATVMDHANVPARVIQDFLGHDNVSTTGIYLGLFEGDEDEAVQAL
jgi:integrase/recombinase XerC